MPEQNESTIRIRRADIDSICVYSVTEDELEQLEKGGTGSLYLNFSLSLLSICVSLLASLLLTDISSQRVFLVFVVFTTISGLAGLILFAIWYQEKKSARSIAFRIRKRLKDETTEPVISNDSIVPGN